MGALALYWLALININKCFTNSSKVATHTQMNPSTFFSCSLYLALKWTLLPCWSCSQNRNRPVNPNRQVRFSLGFGFKRLTSQQCYLSQFLWGCLSVCVLQRSEYDLPSLDSTGWLTGDNPYAMNSYILHCHKTACSPEKNTVFCKWNGSRRLRIVAILLAAFCLCAPLSYKCFLKWMLMLDFTAVQHCRYLSVV